MLLATSAVALFDLQTRGVEVIGTIPAGLPTPAIPTLGVEDLTALVLPAVGVAVVAYSDNDLTGRIFASRNGYSSMPTRSSPRWEPPTSRRGWCRASR